MYWHFFPSLCFFPSHCQRSQACHHRAFQRGALTIRPESFMKRGCHRLPTHWICAGWHGREDGLQSASGKRIYAFQVICVFGVTWIIVRVNEALSVILFICVVKKPQKKLKEDLVRLWCTTSIATYHKQRFEIIVKSELPYVYPCPGLRQRLFNLESLPVS